MWPSLYKVASDLLLSLNGTAPCFVHPIDWHKVINRHTPILLLASTQCSTDSLSLPLSFSPSDNHFLLSHLLFPLSLFYSSLSISLLFHYYNGLCFSIPVGCRTIQSPPFRHP